MKIRNAFLLLLIPGVSIAGLNGLTHHSRANCGNNESISWDFTRNHTMRVVSHHIDNNSNEGWHEIETKWADTWRAAAVHWGEGTKDWTVQGDHWIEKNGKITLDAHEQVEDCSLYNGWWDYNK